MNDDLARSLDDLLSWLDTRYQPMLKRTLTARQYTAQWEVDKMKFRSLLLTAILNAKENPDA